MKRKSHAVLWTLFFGFLGWIYTYKADKWKFWLYFPILVGLAFIITNFSVTIINIVGLAYFAWPLVDQIRRPKKFFENYPK